MTVLTTQQLLEQVETAISAVLTSGQSYQIGDKKYTRADLAVLQQMRQDLYTTYQNENNTGTQTNYASFR